MYIVQCKNDEHEYVKTTSTNSQDGEIIDFQSCRLCGKVKENSIKTRNQIRTDLPKK